MTAQNTNTHTGTGTHMGTGKTDEPKKAARLFSKEQLLASKRFQDRRDIVNALLSPGERYTIAGVEKMIENYMKGRVK